MIVNVYEMSPNMTPCPHHRCRRPPGLPGAGSRHHPDPGLEEAEGVGGDPRGGKQQVDWGAEAASSQVCLILDDFS